MFLVLLADDWSPTIGPGGASIEKVSSGGVFHEDELTAEAAAGHLNELDLYEFHFEGQELTLQEGPFGVTVMGPATDEDEEDVPLAFFVDLGVEGMKEALEEGLAEVE